MPEGPEVEVVRRGLLQVKGKKIIDAEFSIHRKYSKLERGDFIDTSIEKIERYGKFMIWTLVNEKMILNHLGMTGIWRLIPSKEFQKGKLRHPKVILQFEDGNWLVFEDTRIFGKFEIIEQLPPIIRSMGPDILKDGFDYSEFIQRVRGKGKRPRTQEIGNLLLNQSIIAGCGNIYKSESLFKSKINPFIRVNQLSESELHLLAENLIEVARNALESGGSTLRDFSSVEGYSGFMQNKFLVYGRNDKPCYNCGNKILKKRQGGRSTFFCPNCQPFRNL